MTGNRVDASAVVGTSFLVVTLMWTLVLWMGISTVGENNTRGCWVPAEECLHACLLGCVLFSHEGSLDERARSSRPITEILSGGAKGITVRSRSSFLSHQTQNNCYSIAVGLVLFDAVKIFAQNPCSGEIFFISSMNALL